MSLSKTYKKALKVIDSCRTKEQIKGATNYVNLFLSHFTKMGEDSELIKIYYTELNGSIQNKLNEGF